MRTNVLNKSMTATSNKPMSDAIGAAKEAAAAIERNRPAGRAALLDKITAAQKAQEKAKEAKETATTEQAFDKACDEERHAKDKENFYRRQIELLDYTPRMDEGEYDRHVKAVSSTIAEAAADFREVAENAMNAIIKAKAEYMAKAQAADEALIALDKAANVLQTRHRYQIRRFSGDVPDQKIEDRNEWLRHATRFNQDGKAYNLAIHEADGINQKVNAAWLAADRADGKTMA